MVFDDILRKSSLIGSVSSICHITHNEQGSFLLGTFEAEAATCLSDWSVCEWTIEKFKPLMGNWKDELPSCNTQIIALLRNTFTRDVFRCLRERIFLLNL